MANVINQNYEQQLEWHAINWRVVTAMINNLRQRIYRASATGDLKKVRNLQKLMMKSRANHLLAIRKVTQVNRGKHTAGVDNQVINDHKGREHLYKLLSQTTSEKVYPVKRVYIAKKNGKKRPLGIPTILDRCRQAIVKSALEPYWEAKFEPVSYGFRPGRSAHDAIQKIFCIARARGTRHWVLDADIKGAFDNIDHNFLIKKIGGFPERNMIKQWLQAGVLEHGNYIPNVAGTPQGGIISPLLANIALHGMETLLGIQYWKNGTPKQGQPYAVVRYADDFVVFGKSREECETAKIKLQIWLAQRGLALSEEKTSIKHLKEGFDFLGFNIRHYDNRHRKRGYILLTKPSKESMKRYKQQMRITWKGIIGMPTQEGIRQLNAKIIGWCNYYRIGASKRTFSALDQWMWIRQRRYLYRRHPNKHWWWRRKHYLGKIPGREDYSVFMDKSTGGFLWKHAWTKIQRHWLVPKNASPDNPELRDYWRNRQARKQPFIYGVKVNLYKRQKGYCPLCDQELDNGEQLHVHHIQPKAEGGDNKLANLRLLHANCHRQLHSKKGKMLK